MTRSTTRCDKTKRHKLVRAFSHGLAATAIWVATPLHAAADDGTPTAQAQAAAPAPQGRPVTLSEVVARARSNPPSVLGALATLQRFQAQEHQARGAYLPRLTLGAQAGALYNNFPYMVSRSVVTGDVTPPNLIANPQTDAQLLQNVAEELRFLRESGENTSVVAEQLRLRNTTLNANGNATVDWTLIDRSRRGNIEAAEAQSVQQRAAMEGIQRVAVQAAVEIFIRGISAQLLIDDARLSSERRDDQLKSIAALVRAGVRPAVDAQRAEIEAVAARHMLEVRSIEFQAAMAALATALGEDPEKPLRPVPLEHDPFSVPNTLHEATTLAAQNRPEIKQAEAAVAASQATHRSAIGLRLPTIGATATGQITYSDVRKGQGIEGDQYAASGMLYLRWSAFDASLWRRAKVTSQAVIETQKVFESTLLRMKADVAEAHYGAQIAKTMLDRATEMLAAATTTRQAQNERYRAGVSTLLELLDAEEIEQGARRSRIEAARDYDAARARLLAVCGVIERVK